MWRLRRRPAPVDPQQGRGILDHRGVVGLDGLTYARVFGTSAFTPTEPRPMSIGAGLCKQSDLSSDNYRYWCSQIKLPPMLHRKWWEYFFIAQALYEQNVFELAKSGAQRGLVFGVGIEPLPALFAKLGCTVLATDQAPETAQAGGWIAGGMHAAALESLFVEGVCSKEEFQERVSFKAMDMNAIDSELRGFDFCWSTCSFEHLGSLEHGLRFVENSLSTLRSGGIAVHTTEYNLTSNDRTVENKDLCLYRKQDIEELERRLVADGHRVSPISFDPGDALVDGYIDLPPYHSEPHLRIQVGEYACTSIGLIVTKA